jgi:REP element-mobilizing transposase RayT
MTRPLRIEYPGAIYHVLSRGDRREAIVKNDADRELFFELLERTCRRTGWQIHAYCLMSNHFHLVVETPRSNLSAGMQWLLGAYTQQFNRRHRLSGHLFGGRYKALLVDGRRGAYLRQVCDYALPPLLSKFCPCLPVSGNPCESSLDPPPMPSEFRLIPAWRVQVDPLILAPASKSGALLSAMALASGR